MKKVKMFLFTAGIVLAMAFTFSCSGDEGEENLLSYSHCLLSEEKMCLDGPFTSKDCNSVGGKPSDNCPYGVVEPSSSSAPSPSSSSVMPSSSSITLSSSSETASSSSVAQSSSSIGDSCASFVEGTEREHYGKMKKLFCDERDSKEYVYVVIGTQTWMAENLNYAVEGSKCSNCDTYYGRVYDWFTAMVLPQSCNSASCPEHIQSPHQGICPIGWHLPSREEWETLVKFAGGDEVAGKKLKAQSGWGNYSYNYGGDDYGIRSGDGTDNYGFSALPGGRSNGGSDTSTGFYDVGEYGYWWSSSESNSSWSSAGYRSIGQKSDYQIPNFGNYGKNMFFSVRCVKDEAENNQGGTDD